MRTPARSTPHPITRSPFLWGLLLAALFHAPLLLGLATFLDGDFTHHFLPFRLFQRAEWLDGRILPLWNPYTYGGHPFLADVQAGVFYPLNALFTLVGLPLESRAIQLYLLQVEAVVHVGLACAFTHLLVRDLTGRWWAGLVSGLLFGFGGYLTGYPPLQLAILRTAIWLPLIAWLLLRGMAEPGRWRWWLGSGLALTAALLAGHPQTFLHLGYAVAAWVVVLLLDRTRMTRIGPDDADQSVVYPPESAQSASSAFHLLRGLLIAAAIPLALAAVQWLPALEFTWYSVRASVEYAFVSPGFPLRDTWQILFPGILTQFSPLYVGVIGVLGIGYWVLGIGDWGSGNGDRGSGNGDRGSGNGERSRSSSPVLWGVSRLAKRGSGSRERGSGNGERSRSSSPVLWGVSRLAKRGSGGRERGLGAGTRPNLPISQSPNLPPPQYPNIPIPNTQYPIILFFPLLTLVALLLSYGENGPLFRWFYEFAPGWDLFRQQERAAFLVSFGLSVMAGYGVCALPGMALGRRRALGMGGLLLFGVAGLIFGLGWQGTGQTAVSDGAFAQTVALSLGVAAGMAALLWRPGWGRSRSAALVALAFANLLWANGATNLTDVSPARRTLLAPEMAALAQADQSGGGGRIYNEFRLYEDYGMVIAGEDVWGSSPLRSARYAPLFEEFPLDRMWQLLAVEHVVTWRRDLFGPSQRLGEFPQAADTTYLHRLPDPMPRAWLVREVRVAPDPAAIPLLADHGVDLARIAILSPEAAARLPGEVGPGGAGSVTVTRLAPARLRVTVDSPGGGLLVISENWFPGWRIVDPVCAGRCSLPSAPVRANLTLLGVPVPPGQVAFTLSYRPDAVGIGAGVSVAGLTLLAGLIGWRLRRRRQVRRG